MLNKSVWLAILSVIWINIASAEPKADLSYKNHVNALMLEMDASYTLQSIQVDAGKCTEVTSFFVNMPQIFAYELKGDLEVDFSDLPVDEYSPAFNRVVAENFTQLADFLKAFSYQGLHAIFKEADISVFEGITDSDAQKFSSYLKHKIGSSSNATGKEYYQYLADHLFASLPLKLNKLDQINIYSLCGKSERMTLTTDKGRLDY